MEKAPVGPDKYAFINGILGDNASLVIIGSQVRYPESPAVPDQNTFSGGKPYFPVAEGGAPTVKSCRVASQCLVLIFVIEFFGSNNTFKVGIPFTRF